MFRNLFLHNHKANFSEISTQSRYLVQVLSELLKFYSDNIFSVAMETGLFGAVQFVLHAKGF